jgi:hypothetical protein
MIPFTPDDRRAQFAPSQNVGGAVDRDVLDIIGAQPQQTMAAQVDYEVPDIKPVDPDVVAIVNQNQGPLMASLMGASQVNPDQAAEAKRIGSQIGIGQDIALRNMDDVRQRAFMADVQRRDIARANPVLAGFLTDRTFANEASDDIGTLDRVGSFFADIGRAAAGRPMYYTAGELARGYMRGQLVAERGEIGTRAILGEEEETNFARAKQIQAEMRDLAGGGILASTAEVVAQNVAQAREVVGAGLVGGAAGSVIPGIGTMTGFAGGLGTGIVLTTAKMEAGNLYLDLQEQGISDDTAVPIAVGAGLLNGVIEAVGMNVAAAPFRQLAVRVMREQIAEAIQKPTMRAALAAAGKAYVVQVGSEATEEGLQEIVNIAGEELAKGMEGIDSETTMRDAAKRVLDSFVQGAMGGSILGGIGPGANLYVDLRRANKATKQTRFFDDLSKNATESKLKARDAGAYERFVAATADGTGADTVFVDGATIRDVLTQAGVTDTQLDAIIPGMAQQVRQAVELGNDVTLPTSQFAARLAGTKLGDALMPHMRLSPDAMSAMEAQQFEQSREALVEEARALLDAKTEAESAFVQEADQIASSMRDKLVAAGRDPAMAEVEALVHQAFVVTQAARRGMTPSQFEAESGLREIVGVPQVGAPMEQAAIPKPSARVVELLPTSRVLDERGFGPITHPVDGDEVAAGQAMRTVLGGIDVPRKYLKTPEAFDYLLGAINQVLLNKSKDSTDYDRTAASMGRALRTDLATVDDIVIAAKKLGYAGIDQDLRIETEDTLTKTDVMEVLDQIPIAPEMFDQASRIDADYMAAVERGDMATAQRMVDEAARAAGYTIKAFHGSASKPFWVFDPARRGERTGSNSALLGFFASTEQQVAREYQLTEAERRQYNEPSSFGLTLGGGLQSAELALERATQLETSAVRDDEQGGWLAQLTAIDQFGSRYTYDDGFVYDTRAEAENAAEDEKTKEIAKHQSRVDAALQRFQDEERELRAGRTLHDLWVRLDNPLEYDFAGGTFRDKSYSELVQEAIDEGHDGVIMRNTRDAIDSDTVSDVIVFFKSNQAKLADAVTRDEAGNIVPLSRRFDITSPKVFEQAAMFEQAPVSPGFYSALAKAVDAIDAKSIAPSGWKERIKGLVNKGEVKQDEVDWSGLTDWLDMQEGKVTKEAVAEFLKNNGVRVERVQLQENLETVWEVRLRDGSLETFATEAEATRAAEDYETSDQREYRNVAEETYEVIQTDDDKWAVLDAGDIRSTHSSEDNANRARKKYIDAFVAENLEGFSYRATARGRAIGATKFSQYTLPGGTNYREVLITLPVDQEARRAAQERYNELVSEGVPLLEAQERARESVASEYRSSHWDQPNVLVHFRLNDRVDADGKRVLFVEEIQSDWGQQGRKKGFASPMLETLPEGTKLYEPGTSPYDATMAVVELPAGIGGRSLFYGNTIEEAKSNALAFTKPGAILVAPFVTKTEGWLNLALKQIMLEAIKGNYDRVAFINAEQSADRYDLSKQIDSIVYRKNGDGTYDIEAIKGSSVLVTKKNEKASQIEELLGKEITQRIVNGDGEQTADYPSEYKELSGLDLKVGGEGMEGFYDKIVPAAVNKLLKKVGGGKLGQVAMSTERRVTNDEIIAAERRGDFNEAERLTAIMERQELGRGEAPAGATVIGDQPGFDITSEMLKKLESGLPLFQATPSPGPARGGYDPARLKILFGPGADFTTGAHELTHFYVDYYTRQAMAGTATPQMLADLDAMFKFMGVAGDTPEARMAAFNAMPFETSRPLIETITYNAEIYLFEGKAPSLELAGVFDRMLAFFRRAYKSIADFITQQQTIYRREFGRELPVLNDELRAVFDRMLADEQQIKQAQAVAQMRGQFTVKPEGMDDAEWAAYQEMAGEATNAAIADMTKASLRQMEWLSRARSRIIKDMQARHTAQRKEVRERVQREVQQDPLYRAMAFLKRAQIVAPDGATTKAEGVHKIDRVLAAEFAPTVDLARLGGRFGVLQDDGLHPDVVAEMFGYPAGASLLQALADAKPMREVVEDRTDAEMLRLYGEMNTPEAREQEIQKALHNEARARLVGVELRFMGKIRQPVRVLMEAARQAAQQVIDRKRVGELRPSEFIAAEAKASREATAAMQENKPDMAVRAKRAQLLNNQLAKTALEVRDEIDDGVRYLRRVLRDSNRQRMGADVADQIAGLLDRFNIAPMTADEANRVRTLSEFLASLEDRGLVPDIAEAIGMRDTRIPYKNMNIADFRDLVDAIKQLEYIGKNERKILLAKEKAEFQAVRDEIVKSVVDNAGDRKANARTATTNIGRAVTAMKGFAAAHLKAASIVRIMDGGKDGGPLWNYLIRSANEAGDTETTMRAEATADLTKILEPVFRAGKLGGKGIFFPTINRAMNREARLVVALNMGNAGNMQRLLDGEGWSIESVLPVLQSLTEDELNTVQQIWDYFEKYRPMIGQKERRLYGKEPAWVEPQPLVVQSADGKTVTLRGGYYPIKYDPRASQRAETMSEADEAKRDLAGSYTTATTRRSFVKSRVRKVEDQPLLYTLAGMYSGINDVIHDLTWHEWLIQANRLMRSKSFDEAVRNRYGPEYVAQLKNWIKDVAAGERGVQNEAEMALNFLRQGISSAGLGFNIVSAAMQITGFNQSIVRVGARWIGRGIAYVAQNPMVAMREVNEKSEFMRNRSRTQFRELNEIRNMVQGQSVAMRRVQMGTYFLMMRMQRMVDVPTWHGAYEKAMYEGRDEEAAIALADQAVIDSQGGGMVKDLARVERGGPAVKLFTVFYGYMNTVYNMAAVQTMTNKNKGRLAADYVMLFVVPVVLSYMLKQALIPRKGGEDEEWDMSKIGRELAAEQLSYLMGTMVIAREFGEVGKMIFGVEGPRMGYGGPAGLRAVGETYQFATQASQGEFDTAFRKSAVNMIGAFTGLPSAQVNRTLDGLEALYEGETKNVLAPLTGAKKR